MKKLVMFICAMFLMLGVARADLTAPQSPCWKEGSSATATWASVQGANYYTVDVQVFKGDTLIGSMQTGTDATELDVQQEIHRITGSSYDVVEVCFSVSARFIDSEGNATDGPASALSERWTYDFMLNLLPPTDIRLHDDGTLEWEILRDDCQYEIFIYLGSRSEGFNHQASVTRKPGEYTTDESTASCDLAQAIQQTIDEYDGTMHGTSFLVAASMKTLVDYNGTIRKSPESQLCNSIEWYDANAIEVMPPQNVTISEDGLLTWTMPDAADQFEIDLWLTSSRNGFHYQSLLRLSQGDYTVSNGLASYDLATILPDHCKAFEPDVISSAYIVTCNLKTVCSYNEKEYMSTATYSNTTIEWVDERAIPLAMPRNIVLTPEGLLSWDQVEGCDGYNITVYAGANETTFIYETSLQVSAGDCAGEDGRASADISRNILSMHDDAPDDFGDVFYICVCMRALCEKDGQAYQSVETDLTASTEFHARIPVETLTLSPAAPVLHEGNSLYLGKTITPINAYYTSIDWSSDAASTVTVDANGRITGVSPGTANVSAAIGEASCTVPVMVYTISSNIESEEDEEHVTDTAGGIIDDIVNNENPDLGSTDIPEDELDDIRQELQQGIWRGDEMFTDILWYEENFSKYKDNWGQIQKAARELNASFAGAYSIEVEMYHKDHAGANHMIGHIVEFEDEIHFAFDLPTGMKELESGYARKYVLVRVHESSMDTIPVEVADGQFSSSSNCFSDFILLYVDTPGSPVDLSGLDTLTLPASLTVIGTEGLAGTSAEAVLLPAGSIRLSARAFAGCPNLKYIVASPQTVIDAAVDAYDGCSAQLIIQ